ncbi:MAG: HAD family hydrolase [Myxococcota bacterium]|nr:HAD family hydrolase [Myxococcota bacterium]MEC9388719.1 HAD family hydrolase [Myxococcota bacterium]
MKPIHLAPIKVISWDIDGTMYALKPLMAAFKRDLLRRMFSRHWVRAWVDFIRLLRFKLFMDRVRKGGGSYCVGQVPHREAIGATQDEMYGRILPTIGTLEGVEDLLQWFADQGYRQVAFSDYLQSTKLTALGLSAYFEGVYAGESIGHLKPARQAFEHVIADLGIRPEQLLHIGDRADTDGAAGPEVGFQVALVGGAHPSAASLLAMLRDQTDAGR